MKNFVVLLSCFWLGIGSLLAQPVVNLGADTTVCATAYSLQAGNPGASFLWNTGATAPSIIAISSGLYWVEVTDGTGTTRDSINLTLAPPPALSYLPVDTGLCQGVQQLSVQAGTGIVQWLDSFNQLLAIGDTLDYLVTDTTLLWYQASNFAPLSTTFGRSLSNVGTSTGFAAAVPRGIVFTVNEYLRLNSVQMEVNNGPFTADIEIRNGQNDLLYSIPVAFPSAGQHTAMLEVELPVGTNYSMTLQNISGGQARFNSGVNNWGSLGVPALDLVAGVQFPTVYAYFYDWQISLLDPACSSDLDSILINSLETPIVALGNDTTLCGDSLLLDVFNTGASYVWNTGATSSTIFAASSGWYKVTVSQGGLCAVTDSILVSVLQKPIFLTAPSDQDACQGPLVLTAQVDTGVVQWLDSTGQILALGDTLNYTLLDTTRIWYQASYFAPLAATFGRSLSNIGANTGFTAAVPRGIVFNVNEYLRLNSVQMEVDNGPFAATIEIRNAQNNLLYSIPIAFPSAGQYTASLEVELPVGTNYTMTLNNVSGGQARFNSGVTNWGTLGAAPYVDLVRGVQFPAVYAYFYDWQISLLDPSCSSNLASVLINSLETPTVDLGEDTTLCSSSILLDVSNIGATYVWSTGVNSSAIFANTTGTYSVTVTQGGLCVASDSVDIVVLQQPNFTSIPSDQDACQGGLALVATADAGVVQWLDSTGQTLALGDTLQYTVVDTARIWYQASYLVPLEDSVGLSLNDAGTGFTAAIPRGIIFNVNEYIRLNSVQLEVDNGPFTANIELRDAQGTTLYSIPVAFPSAGQYTVPVNMDIPPGVGDSLLLTNITGGQARFNAGVNNWNTLGATPYIELVRGIGFSSIYAYFYDWQISLIDASCSTDLDSVLINSLTTPIVNLGQDTALCSDSLLLDVSNLGGGYVWSTGENTATIFASNSGNYKVTVTQNGLCPVVDSIQVTVVTQPQLLLGPTDQSACRETVVLIAQSDLGVIQWIDSSNQVFALGDTLLYDLEDTTLLRYRAGYFNTLDNTVGLSLNDAGTGFTAAIPRGIIFNVNEYIRLNSVQLEVDNGPFAANIELRDAQGNTLYSIPIAFPSAGQYTVSLNIELPTGMGYSLLLTNITGGQARFNAGVNNWNSLGAAPYVDFVRGIGFSSVYAYFYDWDIAVLSDFCTSEMDSVLLSLLPTPEINLPVDTLVCNDSLLLDVAFPNATYLWTPTNTTTSQLWITQEGTYNITSSVGSCSVSDAITVYLTPIPTATITSADTTTCVATIERRAIGADVIKWYDAPSGGQLLGVGNVFQYFAQTTDTIWATGQDFVNKIYTQGLTDTFVAAQSNYLFPNQIRGLVFNTQEDVLLEEVTMYINRTAFIGTIALWNELDQVIDSQAVILTNLGANTVPLNFTIPRGNDYKLVLLRYNTVDILSEFPFAGFPVVGDQLTIVEGVPFTNVYQYFYNWKVKTLSCASPPDFSVVTVLPTPNLNFPTDTIVCGDSLVLDASGSGATAYSWSTGATTASIVADSSSRVSLIASIGLCSDKDSINIFVVEPPSLIIPPNDTILCEGNATFRASGNATYYAWYDSLNSATPFALGDSIRINLIDSITFWVEGIGFLPQSEPVGAPYAPNATTNIWGEPQNSPFPTRGMIFRVEAPILLNTVDIYVDTFTTATLTLYKTGFPYYSRAITMPNNGRNVVSVDTLLEPGDYRIELSNKSAGRILFSSPFSNSNLRQLNTPNVTFLGSTPVPSQYVYFYNWKISTPSCATNRLPVRVEVPASPVLTLVADTATCTASSLVLDPVVSNNNNYTYAWTNNSTADTLRVNSSGYYGVTVTNNGQCSSTKNTFVQFLATPQGINLPNQSICAPATLDLAAPVNDGLVVWYNSSTLDSVVYLGEPYRQYIADTSTYWLDVAPKATTRIGAQAYTNPNETAAYLNFIIANTFDVQEYSTLDSVAIYVQDIPANVVWEIMDSLGNVLYTGSQTITRAREKIFLPINALLPPSNNYQLSFNSISTAFLVDRVPLNAPSSSAAIARLTGTVFAGVDYTSFFDWHFSYAYPDCHAPVDSFDILVELPVSLADSIYSCDSVLVDISTPNASSYQWSTGATTGQVMLTQAGQYTVTISDGAACTVVDTIVLEQPVPVGLPTIGAICGNVLPTNYLGTNATYLWNTGDTTPTIIVPGPNIYSVTVTTEGGCRVVDSVYIAQLVPTPMPQLGGNRTICLRDTLDAGLGGQGMSYLWNTGAITQRLIVTQSGLYSVTVTHPLGCSGSDAILITLDTLPRANFTVTRSGSTVLMNNISTNIGPTTTYKWFMGDGTQYSIPNPFHSYNDTGCYDILLVVYGSCGNDSILQTIGLGRPDSSCTVAITRLAKAELFQVVPNPSTGSFEIWLERPLQEEGELTIYNSQGVVVATRALERIGQQHHAITLEDLPTGLYFLHWQNGHYQQVQQLLLQRP